MNLIERIEGADADEIAKRDAEIHRLASFIAGIADRSLHAPWGEHTEKAKSKILREIRNGARLILSTAPKGCTYDYLTTTRADRRGNGSGAGRNGSPRLGNPPRRQGLSCARERA